MKPYKQKELSFEDDIKLSNQTLEWDIDYWYSYYSQEKSGEIKGSSIDDIFVYAKELKNAIKIQAEFQQSYPSILGEYELSLKIKELIMELEKY